MLAIARPSVVMRPDGITLPGNCSPVVGSRSTPSSAVPTMLSAPRRRTEKSPASSARVGIVCRDGLVKRLMTRYCWPPKKNSLLRRIGPPNAPSKFLNSRAGFVLLPLASSAAK